MDNVIPFSPVKLCCGQRHIGPVCPDNKVMCCICFERFDMDNLHQLKDGSLEDVCIECASKEEMQRR